MEVVDTDSMQQANLSEELKSQLQDILSGIISTLDVYDVIKDDDQYYIVNLKNNEIIFENIHLSVVANIIASALNTGEEVSHTAIDNMLKYENNAISKMVECQIYEQLSSEATDYEKGTLYEIKLQEAELKSQSAIDHLLRNAENILPA